MSSDTCVDQYILLLKYLSNHMRFITNGYKRFSKTNSTDPRQRVPLKSSRDIGCFLPKITGKQIIVSFVSCMIF